MRVKHFLIPCLFAFCTFAFANDRVKVNMPYKVTVGDKILPPGEYEIKQLDSNGGARHIVQVFSDDGMKFETTVITIPALDNKTPEDTKIVLHRIGDEFYFDKMWVQGKNYGYEFPLPDAVKSRERERRGVDVAAVRQTDAEKESSSTTTTESSTTTRSTTRESTEVVAPARPAEVAQERPAEVAQERPVEVAQARPQERQPDPAPPATPAPSTEAQPATPTPSTEAAPARPGEEMPQTAANWLTMLLGGGALSALGLKLRRR